MDYPRDKILMGYAGVPVFRTPAIYVSYEPIPDPPSAVDELAAVTDADARQRVDAIKAIRAKAFPELPIEPSTPGAYPLLEDE